MAASVMQQGKIDMVIVGADRIAANGDSANKIGTYQVAIAAKYHNIPFYIAAPYSTIDYSIPDGSYIPIEERKSDEIYHCCGVNVFNPAFDVTPKELITAHITERGVLTSL
jgi:methylthioribose-1-phosphate isomerase